LKDLVLFLLSNDMKIANKILVGISGIDFRVSAIPEIPRSRTTRYGRRNFAVELTAADGE